MKQKKPIDHDTQQEYLYRIPSPYSPAEDPTRHQEHEELDFDQLLLSRFDDLFGPHDDQN